MVIGWGQPIVSMQLCATPMLKGIDVNCSLSSVRRFAHDDHPAVVCRWERFGTRPVCMPVFDMVSISPSHQGLLTWSASVFGCACGVLVRQVSSGGTV